MERVVYSPDGLPNGMVGLQTPQGQQLLNEATVANRLMVERSTKQINRTYCGVASLASLVNGINVGYRIKYMQIQGNEEAEEEFLKQTESSSSIVSENDIVGQCDVKEYLATHANIDVAGLTMKQLENVVSILGFGVNVYHACGHDCARKEIADKVNALGKSDRFALSSCDEFKRVAVDFIKRPVTGLIVNYSMSALGYETLCGHFSPLAAYHEPSDQFLVLDPWPETPFAWVKADLLFQAMSTVDSDSAMPRGLLHIHELVC